MNKAHRIAFAACISLFVTSSVCAQTGCFHSPEAPTDVLMLVGAAGMFYGSSAVRKWANRNRKR